MWCVSCEVRSVNQLGSVGSAPREKRENYVIVALMLCLCGKLDDKGLGKSKKRKANEIKLV